MFRHAIIVDWANVADLHYLQYAQNPDTERSHGRRGPIVGCSRMEALHWLPMELGESFLTATPRSRRSHDDAGQHETPPTAAGWVNRRQGRAIQKTSLRPLGAGTGLFLFLARNANCMGRLHAPARRVWRLGPSDGALWEMRERRDA